MPTTSVTGRRERLPRGRARTRPGARPSPRAGRPRPAARPARCERARERGDDRPPAPARSSTRPDWPGDELERQPVAHEPRVAVRLVDLGGEQADLVVRRRRRRRARSASTSTGENRSASRRKPRMTSDPAALRRRRLDGRGPVVAPRRARPGGSTSARPPTDERHRDGAPSARCARASSASPRARVSPPTSTPAIVTSRRRAFPGEPEKARPITRPSGDNPPPIRRRSTRLRSTPAGDPPATGRGRSRRRADTQDRRILATRRRRSCELFGACRSRREESTAHGRTATGRSTRARTSAKIVEALDLG